MKEERMTKGGKKKSKDDSFPIFVKIVGSFP